MVGKNSVDAGWFQDNVVLREERVHTLACSSEYDASGCASHTSQGISWSTSHWFLKSSMLASTRLYKNQPICSGTFVDNARYMVFDCVLLENSFWIILGYELECRHW